MSISLEQLSQILAEVGISSSYEKKILTAVESLNTPPKENESTYEKYCTFGEKQLVKQEIEEDNEEWRHDLKEENRAYESFIEQWFHLKTWLDPPFYFYLGSFQLQQLDLFTFAFFHFSFTKFTMNIFIILLCGWLHWLFDYT